MLAKIAPRFVISRVIQTSYYANYMAVELSKQIIGESGLSFYYDDPKKYYECNFYGFISSLAPPTEFADEFEAEQYHQAVEKLALYNNVKAVFDRLNEFTLEVRELYRGVEANNSSSNFFARSNVSDQINEDDVKHALDRYHDFLEQLEPYPEWKEKVIEQVGKWFLMIHNNLDEGDTKRHLFQKMNRQEYFV